MAYVAENDVKRSGKVTFKTSTVTNAPNVTRSYSALNVFPTGDPAAAGVPFPIFAALMVNMYTRLSYAILPSGQPVTYVCEQQYIDNF